MMGIKLKMNSDAANIYKRICRMISSKIKFDESKNLLNNFYPTNNVKEITNRQNYLKRMFDKIGDIKIGFIKSINFNFKRLNDRILVVSEDELKDALELNLCDVDTEPIKGYPLVLSTQGFGIDVDDISVFEISPETIVQTLYNNRDVLVEVNRIMGSLNKTSVVQNILLEIEKIEDVFEKQRFIEDIDEMLQSKLSEIKKAIEDKIKDEKIVLSGREILDYLSNKKSPKLSKFEEYAIEEIMKAERDICKKLGVNAEVLSKEIFPEINFREVERLKIELEKEFVVERYLKSREIVRRIKNLLPELEEELRLVYEVELVRALKEFFSCYNWCFPSFNNKISFEVAYNLFIQNPQPISYFIDAEDVVVLTGANSGGKTSLLELIAQIQLLAQMGLPVPAKNAMIDVVDEIFFFKRKKTAYNAGAFESTLKSFTSALVSDNKKLVLIDEFEAITEPGAAVKIISEFLRMGYEKRFYMIVVSHMGEELRLNLDFVRVDGIEARGLDDNLNLIVDRQPKIGIVGKSTPELVVERLFRLSKGKRKEILKRILEVFGDKSGDDRS